MFPVVFLVMLVLTHVSITEVHSGLPFTIVGSDFTQPLWQKILFSYSRGRRHHVNVRYQPALHLSLTQHRCIAMLGREFDYYYFPDPSLLTWGLYLCNGNCGS